MQNLLTSLSDDVKDELVVWKELTVAMTPSFFFEGDWLFKAQLRCLSEQINKNFTVLVVDAHFNKRKNYMSELSNLYNLQIVHVPYQPNPNVAKLLDCSIFNAPYCYSESPRIVRYSCWRFVRPDFTDICLNSECNVDFYFHSIEPTNEENKHPETAHNTDVFNFGSDEVNWNKIRKSGEEGATWTHHSEVDSAESLFPKNAYGNYMVFRKDWLNLNGCEEHFSTTHFEDMDFTLRARNLGLTCKRKALKLYRLHHYYGSHSNRSNSETDYSFKNPCQNCKSASYINEPKRFDLLSRFERGEIEFFEDKWICKICYLSGAIYHANSSEYCNNIEDTKRTKSTINHIHKIGRNLKILTSEMDGKNLKEKVNIFNNSWNKNDIYQKKINNTTKDRIELLEEVNRMFPNGKFVEIGVASGCFTKQILASCPDLSTLDIIDSWEFQPDGYNDPCNLSQSTQDERYEQILKDFENEPKINIIRGWSNASSNLFSDESIDFLYLDANHSYDATKEDLNAWYNKIKTGGIFAGHDYIDGDGLGHGVKKAVDEFAIEKNLVICKTENEYCRPEGVYGAGWEGFSFYFVKP